MCDDKKDNILTTLTSLKGSQRATPSSDLFAKIEQEINQPEVAVIPLSRLKWIAAAAVLLLLINGLTIQQNYKHHKNAPIAESAEGKSIISNYTLYHQ